jgi:hypothetical protein
VTQIDDTFDPADDAAAAALPSRDLVDRMERLLARLEGIAVRLESGQGRELAGPGMPRPVELIEQRRAAFRPAVVRLLFLVSGMPRRNPPDLTDFYLASGHLYRSIRAAFVVMEGERAVPTGEAFLHYFRERGCWLVALPTEPTRDRGRPSNRTRNADRAFVRRVITSAAPEFLITITTRVAALAEEATIEAGVQLSMLEAVTVPKDLWQQSFIPRLRRMVGEAPPYLGAFGPGRAHVEFAAHVLTLSDVERVLLRNRNKRMRVYRIAESLMADGKGLDVKQLSSAVRRLLKRNRAAFDQNGAGIRMARAFLASEPTDEVFAGD